MIFQNWDVQFYYHVEFVGFIKKNSCKFLGIWSVYSNFLFFVNFYAAGQMGIWTSLSTPLKQRCIDN